MAASQTFLSKLDQALGLAPASTTPAVQQQPSPQPAVGTIQQPKTFRSEVEQWNPIIDRVSQEYPAVPKDFVKAIIEQESGGYAGIDGQPTRYGTAKGLGQFIDRTASEFIPDWTGPQDSYDPEKNIRGIFAYAESNLNKYGGDLNKAAQAHFGFGYDPVSGKDSGQYSGEVMNRFNGIGTIQQPATPKSRISPTFSNYLDNALAGKLTTTGELYQPTQTITADETTITPPSEKEIWQRVSEDKAAADPLQVGASSLARTVGQELTAGGMRKQAQPEVSPEEIEAATRGRAIAEQRGIDPTKAKYHGAYPIMTPEVRQGLNQDQISDLYAYMKQEGFKRRSEAGKKEEFAGKVATNIGEGIVPMAARERQAEETIQNLDNPRTGVIESFKMGDAGGAMSGLYFDAMMSGDQDAIRRVTALYDRYGEISSKKAEADKGKGEFWKTVDATAQMLPMMGKSVALSAVPAVGQILSTSMWARQGAGDILYDMHKNDIPDEIAIPIAMNAGAAYGLLGQLQVKQAMNPGVREAIKKPLLEQAMKLARTKAVDIEKEIGEEVAQGIVSESAFRHAAKVAGIPDDQVDAMRQDYVSMADEIVKQTAGPMALISLPGAARGAKNIAFSVREQNRVERPDQKQKIKVPEQRTEEAIRKDIRGVTLSDLDITDEQFYNIARTDKAKFDEVFNQLSGDERLRIDEGFARQRMGAPEAPATSKESLPVEPEVNKSEEDTFEPIYPSIDKENLPPSKEKWTKKQLDRLTRAKIEQEKEAAIEQVAGEGIENIPKIKKTPPVDVAKLSDEEAEEALAKGRESATTTKSGQKELKGTKYDRQKGEDFASRIPGVSFKGMWGIVTNGKPHLKMLFNDESNGGTTIAIKASDNFDALQKEIMSKRKEYVESKKPPTEGADNGLQGKGQTNAEAPGQKTEGQVADVPREQTVPAPQSEVAAEPAPLPKIGDEIEYRSGIPEKTYRKRVVRIQKDPVTGDDVPVVEFNGKEWPVSEWYDNGKIIKEKLVTKSISLPKEKVEEGNAEGTGNEARTPSEQPRAVGGEKGRLRVRNDASHGMEAEAGNVPSGKAGLEARPRRSVKEKGKRKAGAVKLSHPEERYTAEYWQAHHAHKLNVELYNALRHGWKNKAGKQLPGMQKGWIDDFNILTESNLPGGSKNPSLSHNAKEWMQDVVDSVNDDAVYRAELDQLGIPKPEHIDDVADILLNSKNASQFVEFHNQYEKSIGKPQEEYISEGTAKAIQVFHEEPWNLSLEQADLVEQYYGDTVDNLIAAYDRNGDGTVSESEAPPATTKSKQLSPEEMKQQDLFGEERSVKELEADEESRLRKNEIQSRIEKRKGGEADLSHLPMFEDQDFDGSQGTLNFAKGEKPTETKHEPIPFRSKAEEELARIIYKKSGKEPRPGSVKYFFGKKTAEMQKVTGAWQ